MINKSEKESLVKQEGFCVWFTGLSGSGKTTLANAVETQLYRSGHLTQWLDGDKVRRNLNCDLGFSESDREENIRRVAEVTHLFVNCGIICLNSFITPTEKLRSLARKIVGRNDFIEVFLDCTIEICRQRDPKGLYRKAEMGEIINFTGIDAVFENPEYPDLIINTGETELSEAVEIVLNHIETRLKPH